MLPIFQSCDALCSILSLRSSNAFVKEMCKINDTALFLMQRVQRYQGFRAVEAQRVAVVARNVDSTNGRKFALKIQAARVGGVEIPNAKKIEFSLQYIYGVGHTTAKAILTDTVRHLLSGRDMSPSFCT